MADRKEFCITDIRGLRHVVIADKAVITPDGSAQVWSDGVVVPIPIFCERAITGSKMIIARSIFFIRYN